MFTVDQRDALRDWVLRLAHADDRVVAGAAVGSLAAGEGDRFSDLDLTFGVADEVRARKVLGDWTSKLTAELAAVCLADLEVGHTIYRVFLLPDALQFDLSMTRASQFRPGGPRFRLLFGETVHGQAEQVAPPASLFISVAPNAEELFGWGVIYALHARACIERGRVWQAEHYVGAVRDHALSMACLRHGLAVVQARGYDDLPAKLTSRYAQSHVGGVEPPVLRAALAECLRALVREGSAAEIETVDLIASRVAELCGPAHTG